MLFPSPRRAASAVFVAAVATAIGAAGCSAGGGRQTEAGVFDATYEVSLDLPAGCPPPQENDKGIGRACTRGGGQCPSSSDLYCTCDTVLGLTVMGVPCVCTRIGFPPVGFDAGDPCGTAPSGFCGTGATCCPYQSVGYLCVPNICLPDNMCPDLSGLGTTPTNPDAGPDADPDAGM